MKFLLLCISGLLCSVCGKTITKSLTESLGQEIIELASPLKDLNSDIEEEPSAEVDDAVKVTSTLLPAATARDVRKTVASETRRKMKDIDKIAGIKQEDEESKIEKQLSDMYKDIDYKADSSENTKEENVISVSETEMKEETVNNTSKPIERMRNNFQFQPDVNNPKEVEKFRTSIDDISCQNNKLTTSFIIPDKNSGCMITVCRAIVWGLFALI